MAARLIAAGLIGAVLALSGCLAPGASDPSPGASAGEIPSPTPLPNEPSAESRALTAYFASVENFYRTQGNLRTDGGDKGTPFDARRMTAAFLNIAFYNEFHTVGGRSLERKTSTKLSRWAGPIRVNVEFGQSSDAGRQIRDLRAIDAFLARLSRLSGLSVNRPSSGPANVLVMVMNEDERRAAIQRIANFTGGIDPAQLATIRDPAKSTYCIALTIDADNDHVFEKALVIIRAETPDLLRLSCIHEELAQMMGLTNDDPAARPSIFNDDEEFATLTKMDEYLMRILYDPRLTPGMSEAEGKGIVETIAAELLAQASGT